MSNFTNLHLQRQVLLRTGNSLESGVRLVKGAVICLWWADFCVDYFRLLSAFRIMPVKMLNIPAIMNKVVNTVLPMASWPVVVAI